MARGGLAHSLTALSRAHLTAPAAVREPLLWKKKRATSEADGLRVKAAPRDAEGRAL